tara:strand:- start:1148 stop:1861 length:714 start_codon:yes stop_codon:yes gene_type:complete
MGQNSIEVAYGFGQMGSVFTNLAKPVYPPKDHVIVAIQCLDTTAFTELETETLDTMGPQFPTHQDDELASAGGPDANYLGVVEAPATSATAAGLITLTTDVAATNALIKPGQVILIGADADTIDAGFTVDTAAGNITPIYQGPNKQYLEVVSITGGGTGAGNVLVQVKAVGGATAIAALAALANIDTSNTIYFLDSYHAAGGTTVETVDFPKGVTIYGRWTAVTTSTTVGIICYFGK